MKNTEIENNEPEGSLIVEKSLLYKNRVIPGSVEIDEHRIRVRKFQTANATVSISCERRENLTNYEHGQVRVSITMPCYAEEVPPMLATLSDRVPAKLEEVMDTWLGGLGYQRQQIGE